MAGNTKGVYAARSRGEGYATPRAKVGSRLWASGNLTLPVCLHRYPPLLLLLLLLLLRSRVRMKDIECI